MSIALSSISLRRSSAAGTKFSGQGVVASGPPNRASEHGRPSYKHVTPTGVKTYCSTKANASFKEDIERKEVEKIQIRALRFFYEASQ